MRRTVALAAVGLIMLAGLLAFPALSGAGPSESGFRPCTPNEVRRLVLAFVAAFNAGDRTRLDNLVASDDGDGDAGTPSFQWYSTGQPGARLGRAAHERSTLIAYFAARHRAGERASASLAEPGRQREWVLPLRIPPHPAGPRVEADDA